MGDGRALGCVEALSGAQVQGKSDRMSDLGHPGQGGPVWPARKDFRPAKEVPQGTAEPAPQCPPILHSGPEHRTPNISSGVC